MFIVNKGYLMSNEHLDKVSNIKVTPELASSVKKCAARADRVIYTFKDIRKQLNEENTDISLGISLPAYDEILTDDNHWEEISYVYQIIDKYRDCDFDTYIGEIDQDLIHLQAGIVRLSTLVGFTKGLAVASETDRKFVHAKVHIQIKEIADRLGLKITDSAAEKMSRTETSEYQEISSYHITANEMLQTLYYSAQAFVRVLEGVAQRYQHEKYSQHYEG